MIRWPLRHRRVPWTGVAAVFALAWPGALLGQAGSTLPPVLATLEGSWEGSGVLFDRPASFRMQWTVAGGGFVRLEFANFWIGDGERLTPVLASHAVYYVRDSSAVGVWVDSRPQRIDLEAAITDTSVVTSWTAVAEAGRTEYVVRSRDLVVVRDFVYANGSERLFADATYRRRSGDAGRQ